MDEQRGVKLDGILYRAGCERNRLSRHDRRGWQCYIGNNLAADGLGNLYLTGAFRSTDGPATFGAFSLTSHTDQFDVPDYDFFLTKLGTGGNPPAGPRLGGLTFLGGGVVQMQLSGGSSTVIIERSADLGASVKISTNSVSNGVVTFSDATVGNTSAQFYRVSTLP